MYVELRRLHRRFGHPQVDRPYKLLRRANVQDVNAHTGTMLESIESLCSPCQEYTQRSRRFKFTLRDDVDFKHTIYAEIFI